MERATIERPLLTVVVGAATTLVPSGECLRSIESQAGPGVEVIVIQDVEAEVPARRAAGLVREHPLVPELWTEGIRRANGRIVALTTTTVVPEPGWVRALLDAHQGEIAAVGGAIEPPLHNRLVDWAVYFCRYTRYMPPLVRRLDPDLPGDNVAYRAEALDCYATLFTDGFWEPRIHEAMRADGRILALDPGPVVRQAGGMRIRSFSRQRFLHGKVHGAMRCATYSRGQRLLRSLGEGFVPFLMTARVLRTLLARRRHLGRCVCSLPLLLWFFGCWAAGELVGTWSRAKSR